MVRYRTGVKHLIGAFRSQERVGGLLSCRPWGDSRSKHKPMDDWPRYDGHVAGEQAATCLLIESRA
jgi:hypothetical protein